MKKSDILKIIKNKITTKKSCLFIIFSFITLIILYACVTIINISSDYKNVVSKSYIGRTLIINSNELEKIKKIKEIEIVDSVRYLNSKNIETISFVKGKENGTINLKPILNDNDIIMEKGRKVAKQGEIICPSFFYPYELYNFNNNVATKNYEKNLVVDNIMKYNNLILLDEDGNTKSFKIVGSYKNNPLEEINTCYITKEDFEYYKDNIDYCSENNDGIEECYEYNTSFVRIKEKENIEKVTKELDELGVSYFKYFSYNENVLNSLTNLPVIIATIIFMLIVIIIYIWLKKKSIYDQEMIALYKTIGFREKYIKQIFLYEIFILQIISVFVSLFTYIIIYNNFNNKYLIEFIYNNYYIKIPVFQILTIIVLIVTYTIIMYNFILNKINKTSINRLYREGM